MKTNDSDRIVEGYGTVEIVDNQGDFVPVSKIAEIMPIYMERGGVLMDTHTNRHVGRLLDWKLVDDDGKPAMWLKAQIFNDFSIDNMIWDAVKEGHYTGFSFGGRSLDKEVVCDGAMCHNRINNLEMWEWSIVPKPANKLSTIKHFSEDKVAKGGSFLAKGLIPELSSEGDIVYRMIDVAIGGDVLNKACSCEEEDEKAHLEPLDHIRREPCPLDRKDSGRSHAGHQKARSMPERIEKEDEYMEEEKAYGYHGQNTSRNMEFGHKPFRPNPQDVNRERNTRHDVGAYGRFDAHDMAQVDPGDKEVRGQIESDYKARSATGKNNLKARKTGERYDRLSEREKSDMEYEEEKAGDKFGYHGTKPVYRDSGNSRRDDNYDLENTSMPVDGHHADYIRPKAKDRGRDVHSGAVKAGYAAGMRGTDAEQEARDIGYSRPRDIKAAISAKDKQINRYGTGAKEKSDMEYEEEKSNNSRRDNAWRQDEDHRGTRLNDPISRMDNPRTPAPRRMGYSRNEGKIESAMYGETAEEREANRNPGGNEHRTSKDNAADRNYRRNFDPQVKKYKEQEKSDMDYYEKEDTPVSPPSSGSDAPLNKILSKLEAMEQRITKLEGGEKKEGQAFSQMAEEHKGEEAEKAETPKTVKTPLPDQYGAGPSSTDDHQMGSDKKITGLNKTNDPAAIVREELKKMGFQETPRPRYTGQSVDMTGNGPITVSGMLAKAAESGVATAISGQGNNLHSTLSKLSFKDLHQILE